MAGSPSRQTCSFINLGTHHLFAGYAKFGNCTMALTSETTTFASAAFMQQKEEGKSDTQNEKEPMKQPENKAKKSGVKANIAAIFVAAYVMVTVVGVLGAVHLISV